MLSRKRLEHGWRLQTSAVAGVDGAAIAQAGYDPAGWHAVRVPQTALSALVADGTYPDPRVWPQSFRVPDASDKFNADQDLARYSHLAGGRNPWRDPWWYRTEVELPPLVPDQRVWLNLDCLNYRADVWVNGRRVADREQLVGMFQRFRLDITAQAVAGTNAVAILVHPVDHPGDPDAQTTVYGPVRQFHQDICHDVTEIMTVGYDCFPTVPDRNLGLIQEVWVDVTGPVDLRHPFVRCDLDLPALNPARLTVSTEAVNTTAQVLRGTLSGTVTAPDGTVVARFARPTTLAAHETRLLTIATTDAPELVLADPQLWWPNTYGDQPLYTLTLRFELGDEVSSEVATHFGIRRIDRELYELDGAHGFRLLVNGRRIFQRGGYIQPEMTFDWDRTRVEAELRYFAHANLNYVVFEDIPNPPDWYLDLCDRYGLLFWNCFYCCYWLQYNRPWSVDLAVLDDCTVDLVKRYRNHPSLVIYLAQNEGETREDVYELWRRTVLALDDTRFLVPSGSFPDYRTGTPAWFDRELPVGLNDYNPKTYSWQMPWVYFDFVRRHRNWMFMIESCSASVPPVESLLRFMPHLADLGDNPGGDPTWPLDEAWAHYGANSYYEWFDRGLRLLYGEPKDLRDYVWKAHLVAYDQHRAFFEAVHHRMWSITSGFGHWKLNSAFPDVQWQLHDWYLRPMVSSYAVRRACAALAVQFCPLDRLVSVVNNRADDLAELHVQARVFDRAARLLGEQAASVAVAANSAQEVLELALPTEPLYFVKLALRDRSGALLADNFYWLSPRLDDCETVWTGDDFRSFPANRPLAVPRQTPCFPELAELPPVALAVSAVAEGAQVTVRLANPTDQLAFFIRARLLRADDGEELLPVYWSDNYLSLLPGESCQLTADLPVADAALRLAVDGWNLVPQAVPVASARA